MDPFALIPTPDTLPVSWGWFQLLLIITLFLHIILMNVMLGTGIIAFVSNFRGASESDPLTRQTIKMGRPRTPITVATQLRTIVFRNDQQNVRSRRIVLIEADATTQ